MRHQRVNFTATDSDELKRRVRELEASLLAARALAEQERRRAELAEASSRRAWALASWPRGDTGRV